MWHLLESPTAATTSDKWSGDVRELPLIVTTDPLRLTLIGQASTTGFSDWKLTAVALTAKPSR